MTYERIYPSALALIVFFQTVFPKMVPVSIILLLLVVIAGIVKGFLKWNTNFINVLFIGTYIAYFIGSFYTQDPELAKMYLENKLSFVIFPLLFSFKPNFSFSLRIPAISLITGVLLISLWGMYKMASCMYSASLVDCLPYFSDIHHPSYFAAYILFSMIFCLYGYNRKWKGFGLLPVVLFSIFGIIASLLSFSLAGVLFLTIVLSFYIWAWMKKKYGLKIALSLTICLFASLSVFIYSTGFKEDFKYTSRSLSAYIDSPEEFVRNGNRYLIGNEVRLILWTVTGQLIAEHPFGVGTGNTDIYMMKKLQDYGLYDLASYKYNPHNQFLQTFLEIGIFGFLILVSIVTIAIHHAVKTKNWLLFILAAGLVFNCLFESMLQRQSGIVFYTFWMCLLYIHSKQTKNNIIEA